MTYALWALVLVLQAGSSTWASRARNTGSVGYHGVAAIFSHGVWFVSATVLVDSVTRSAEDPWQLAAIGIFYTFFCVVGSVAAHWASAKWFEGGKRRVGA